MNTMQRIVLWIGSILVILSALFPPWTAGFAITRDLEEQRLATPLTLYAPISEAPQPRWVTSVWQDPVGAHTYKEGAFRIDANRLLLQELTILIVTAMVYKALSPKTKT